MYLTAFNFGPKSKEVICFENLSKNVIHNNKTRKTFFGMGGPKLKGLKNKGVENIRE